MAILNGVICSARQHMILPAAKKSIVATQLIFLFFQELDLMETNISKLMLYCNCVNTVAVCKQVFFFVRVCVCAWRRGSSGHGENTVRLSCHSYLTGAALTYVHARYLVNDLETAENQWSASILVKWKAGFLEPSLFLSVGQCPRDDETLVADQPVSVPLWALHWTACYIWDLFRDTHQQHIRGKSFIAIQEERAPSWISPLLVEYVIHCQELLTPLKDGISHFINIYW